MIGVRGCPMKSSRVSIALYFLLLTVLLLTVGWRTWDSAHTYPATLAQ